LETLILGDQREFVTGLVLHGDRVCPIAMYMCTHDNSPSRS
jgi:hypothetical protein